MDQADKENERLRLQKSEAESLIAQLEKQIVRNKRDMDDFRNVIAELEINLSKARGDALDNNEDLNKKVSGLNSEMNLLKEMVRSSKV